MLKLSLILGAIAALADVAGGLVLVRAQGVERYLRYFVALGAGFLMATALLEMTPESLRLSPRLGPILIMAGYCVVHLLEHTINAHFHFGEETHTASSSPLHTGYSVLGGLSLHALFDGVAIGSGFVISNWLGWLIFLAIFLHKAPEGFTMASVMLASGRSRAAAFYSTVALAAATVAGVLVIALVSWMAALWAAHFGRRGSLRCRNRPGARGQPRARHPHGAGLLCRRRRVPAAADAAARALTCVLAAKSAISPSCSSRGVYHEISAARTKKRIENWGIIV